MTLYHRRKPPSAVCVQTSTECSDQLLICYAGIPVSTVTSVAQNVPVNFFALYSLCGA